MWRMDGSCRGVSGGLLKRCCSAVVIPANLCYPSGGWDPVYYLRFWTPAFARLDLARQAGMTESGCSPQIMHSLFTFLKYFLLFISIYYRSDLVLVRFHFVRSGYHGY